MPGRMFGTLRLVGDGRAVRAAQTALDRLLEALRRLRSPGIVSVTSLLARGAVA